MSEAGARAALADHAVAVVAAAGDAREPDDVADRSEAALGVDAAARLPGAAHVARLTLRLRDRTKLIGAAVVVVVTAAHGLTSARAVALLAVAAAEVVHALARAVVDVARARAVVRDVALRVRRALAAVGAHAPARDRDSDSDRRRDDDDARSHGPDVWPL